MYPSPALAHEIQECAAAAEEIASSHVWPEELEHLRGSLEHPVVVMVAHLGSDDINHILCTIGRGSDKPPDLSEQEYYTDGEEEAGEEQEDAPVAGTQGEKGTKV